MSTSQMIRSMAHPTTYTAQMTWRLVFPTVSIAHLRAKRLKKLECGLPNCEHGFSKLGCDSPDHERVAWMTSINELLYSLLDLGHSQTGGVSLRCYKGSDDEM